MTLKERILLYAKHKGITQVELCNSVDISISNFRGVAKESELSSGVIVKILTQYPEINAYWLLLGEGEMLKKSTSPDTECSAGDQINVNGTNNIGKSYSSAERDEIITLRSENASLREQVNWMREVISTNLKSK